MTELKQYIAEAFSKEYGFRVKIASDCGSDHMDIIEKCLAKYNLVSATPFKRTPIEENPMEFQTQIVANKIWKNSQETSNATFVV